MKWLKLVKSIFSVTVCIMELYKYVKKKKKGTFVNIHTPETLFHGLA